MQLRLLTNRAAERGNNIGVYYPHRPPQHVVTKLFQQKTTCLTLRAGLRTYEGNDEASGFYAFPFSQWLVGQ